MNVVDNNKKVIILTPSKCSTYSLKTFLEELGFNFNPPRIKDNSLFYHATLKEICYGYWIPPNALKDFKIIQITRNPYDRLISAFFSQKLLYPFLPNFQKFLSNLHYTKYLLPEFGDKFYSTFYGDLAYKFESLKNNNWGGLRFYWEQNFWNDLNTPVQTFKLEEISKDSSSLCNYLNVPHKPYPKINSKNYPKVTLTQDEKNLIYDLYYRDFQKYNYSKDSFGN